MLKILILYFILINFISCIVMYIDKQKAIHKEWRISEANLIFLSLIGGSIGMLLGMSLFRHKTKHIKFTLGVPLILIIQIFVIVFLVQKY